VEDILDDIGEETLNGSFMRQLSGFIILKEIFIPTDVHPYLSILKMMSTSLNVRIRGIGFIPH
jgi:hypothetical protein